MLYAGVNSLSLLGSECIDFICSAWKNNIDMWCKLSSLWLWLLRHLDRGHEGSDMTWKNTIMKMMVQSDQKIMRLVSSFCDSEFHGDTLLNHPTDVTRTFCNFNYVWFWIKSIHDEWFWTTLVEKNWKDNETMYDEWFRITLAGSPEDFSKSFKPGGSSNSTRILGNHLDIFYT